MAGPLTGKKVIEFATYVAAPSATRVLADLGAEVIKVETATGDDYRTNWIVYMMPGESDLENPCYDIVGVNKRFTSLNLKTEEGREAMYRLCDEADVFVTSMRDKALLKLGVDWETLHARNPRLLWAQVRGYGEHGELRDEPGYDYTAYHARSGVGGSLYEAGGPPMPGGTGYGDQQTGMSTAAAIMGAMVRQSEEGVGDRIIVSLHAVGVYMMGLTHGAAQYGNYILPTSRKIPFNPFNNTYQTKDGKWIQFCVAAPQLGYNHFMETIGRGDLVDDPRYQDQDEMRKNHHREFIEILEEALATKTLDEWIPIFRENDIAHAPIMSSTDVLNDPECWDNGYVRKVQYPTGNEAILFPTPFRLDSVGEPPLRPSRGIGADTFEVLKEYGYTDEELAAMNESGAILQHE